MELYIRSQNRLRLVKVNGDITITHSLEPNYHMYVDITYIGEYKTEERAIEILNEIQNIIKPKPILQAKPILSKENMDRLQDDYGMTVLPSCVDVIEPISTSFVYEMPKE